tara:strand:+ start:1431 stop:1742 length:312 start_codon:yes stop_codon:yes gene_type:complete
MIDEIVGYSAITVAAVSFLPQVKQIIITKKVRDINFPSFILNVISCFLYIIYGYMVNNNIVIISVISPIFVQLLMIYFICKYKNIKVIDISNNLQLEDNSLNV